VAGSATQQAALSTLVGKEAAGRAQDPEATWLALAAPIGPKLWLWVLHPSTAVTTSGAIPVLLAVSALMLGILAFFLRRGRAAAAPAQAATGSGIKVFGSPRMTDELGERKRRGTQPYDQPEE